MQEFAATLPRASFGVAWALRFARLLTDVAHLCQLISSCGTPSYSRLVFCFEAVPSLARCLACIQHIRLAIIIHECVVPMR